MQWSLQSQHRLPAHCHAAHSGRPSLAPRGIRLQALLRDTAYTTDQHQQTSGQAEERRQTAPWRAAVISLSAAFLAGALAVQPAHALQLPILQIPFLQSQGARGPLVEEEARLLRLRRETEGPVREEIREELQRARHELEAEGRLTQSGKLCATPFGVDVVGITELVALTGALVGGVTARQRKNEVEVLNEQLRKINLNLRQQARVSTMYTPGLNFAERDSPQSASMPPAQSNGRTNSSMSTSATATLAAPTSSMFMSQDEEDQGTEVRQCVAALREGKRLLREKQGASAMVRFEKALMLAKGAKEALYERRSTRGLAAAARLQGQQKTAIQHLERVLEISNGMGDHVGDADAYGTIADIYTDMGQFEKAAKYYDQYIEKMNSDGPV